MHRFLGALILATLIAAAGTGATAAASQQPSCTNSAVTCRTGTAADGSTWKIEVPEPWRAAR